jgi:pyruvate dehydrogenase E1 component alpha subunit
MLIIPESSKALGMYRKMYLIRKYEERIYFLFLEGIMPGSIHQSHGQEACAVGMLYDLIKGDYMASTHRPAGHDLAIGVSVKSMMCEMFGKSNGCCHGKGGAMHTGDIDVGAVPANAIVGGNIPIAVGLAMSCKIRKTNNVAISFFGDGASNEGSFHEGLNGAAIWNLPVIFVCENNKYGASTSIKATCKLENIADRAAAYGIPGEVVDGNDVLAVNDAACRAIERARKGCGPSLLELKTYRIPGHSRSDACAYRSKEEEKEWFARDPIQLFKNMLLKSGKYEEAQLKQIEEQVEAEIEEAVELAMASPDPLPEDALKNVFWEGDGTNG